MSDSRQYRVRWAGTIETVLLDHDRCYRAISSRDARFDGRFVVAVRTTGIYCRPSCPAVTPKPQNVVFLPTAAAAQLAGYRACRRCLPDAVPGSPEWNLRGDLVARAVRLIADGVVERRRSARVSRPVVLLHASTQPGTLTAELGAGALALAKAHRAQAPRVLIETTTLPLADVAFAAGFASVRQFNDAVQVVYATTPTDLRRHATPHPTPGALTLRLPFRIPMDGAGLLDFLAARAIPTVECAGDHGYARTLRLPHGLGAAAVRLTPSHWECTLRLADLRDLPVAVSRLRRLLDADADPCAVDEVLGADPVLATAVAGRPGIRVPGTVDGADGAETVLRAVLGQQVTVASARTAAARLVTALGEPVPAELVVGSEDTVFRLFPAPAAIAEHAAEVLTGPRRRIDTVRATAAALATGDLVVDPGRDPEELRVELEAIPGIGPWTAGYVALRVLGATDVLLDTDLAIRHGAAALGLACDAGELRRWSRRWRPWRSYAGMHLWRAAATRPRRTERTA